MELTTERLRLTGLDLERDTADLYVAYADTGVMTPWLGEPVATGPDETRMRLAARAGLPGAYIWVVRRAGEDTALGLVELIGATPLPSLSWMLRRDAWGQGVMTEAVGAVVDHLLRSVDRVEAWADSTNPRSLRVAAKCGLAERSRFARVDGDGHPYETVVLGRFAPATTQRLFGAEAVLPVRDVDATLDLLVRALGCRAGFRVGEPTRRAGVRVGPWSMGPGFQLARRRGPYAPVTVVLEAAAPVTELWERARAAGARLEGAPVRTDWGSVDFCCLLPEGHRIEVTGPG